MKENYKEFLKELGELTKKYGLAIDGCGCCGSPFLVETEPIGEYFCTAEGDMLKYCGGTNISFDPTIYERKNEDEKGDDEPLA